MGLPLVAVQMCYLVSLAIPRSGAGLSWFLSLSAGSGRAGSLAEAGHSFASAGRASLDVQGNPAAELQTIARCLWEAQHYVDQVNWLSLGSVHVPALTKALQEKNDFLQATAVFFPLCLPLKNSSLFHTSPVGSYKSGLPSLTIFS